MYNSCQIISSEVKMAHNMVHTKQNRHELTTVHKIILKNSQYNLKLIQNIKVIPLNISFNSKCFFFENEQSKNTPVIKTC